MLHCFIWTSATSGTSSLSIWYLSHGFIVIDAFGHSLSVSKIFWAWNDSNYLFHSWCLPLIHLHSVFFSNEDSHLELWMPNVQCNILAKRMHLYFISQIATVFNSWIWFSRRRGDGDDNVAQQLFRISKTTLFIFALNWLNHRFD